MHAFGRLKLRMPQFMTYNKLNLVAVLLGNRPALAHKWFWELFLIVQMMGWSIHSVDGVEKVMRGMQCVLVGLTLVRRSQDGAF